jgi:hypothetical protein
VSARCLSVSLPAFSRSHSHSHCVTIETRKPAYFRGQKFGRAFGTRENARFSPPSHGGNTGSTPVCATSSHNVTYVRLPRPYRVLHSHDHSQKPVRGNVVARRQSRCVAEELRRCSGCDMRPRDQPQQHWPDVWCPIESCRQRERAATNRREWSRRCLQPRTM